MTILRGRLFRLTPKFFGQELSQKEFLEEHVAPTKIVVLGEYHGAAPIIQLQTSIQETMARSIVHLPMMATSVAIAKSSEAECPLAQSNNSEHKQDEEYEIGIEQISNLHQSPKVRVIMEHFSMEMQQILDQFQIGNLDTAGFIQAYKDIGTEGHNLNPYLPILSSALENNRINLYGGFIPRPYARMIMREGLDQTIERASQAGFISADEQLRGTDGHYNFFESLLTGRDIHSDPHGKLATDRFRAKMFPAQLIKDASMAWCAKNINEILNVNGQDRMLIVCGVGHMLYSHGVPERILENSSNDDDSSSTIRQEDMLRVACLPMNDKHIRDESEQKLDTEALLKDAYGGPDSNAADVCFLYIEEIEDESKDEEIIKETKDAYDKVGATAHLEGGNMQKAHAILSSLHYTSDEIAFAGADAVNYQGVGCPHRHIDIQEGEAVADFGSGLGVDSMIARGAVGPNGLVVGIDLSTECVGHANKRAQERGFQNMSFVQSSIDNIGDKAKDISQKSGRKKGFDAIISNGAFCLLPNKKKGFEECFRLLNDGGRIAICTTVIKDTLEHGVEWPLCMQTFAKMNEIEPMLRKLGFVDIELDLSDSDMEVPEAVEEETSECSHRDNENKQGTGEQDKEKENGCEDDGSGRFKVHNDEGSDEFRHLENFDMNALCARVVIKARKP